MVNVREEESGFYRLLFLCPHIPDATDSMKMWD